MDVMTGQCRAEFYGGGTRCELGDGHAGNHLRSGFAQWDEPLSHYPAEVAPTGGLLDMLEPGDLEGYCRGCGDPASKHEGSFCVAHYSGGRECD